MRKQGKIFVLTIIGIAVAVGIANVVGLIKDVPEGAKAQDRLQQKYDAAKKQLKDECDKLADDPFVLAEVEKQKAARLELVELRARYNHARKSADGGDIALIARDYGKKALAEYERHTAFVDYLDRRFDQIDLLVTGLNEALDPITGPMAFEKIKNPSSEQLNEFQQRFIDTSSADIKQAKSKLVNQVIEPLNEVIGEIRRVCNIAHFAIWLREQRGESITDETRQTEFMRAAADILALRYSEDLESGLQDFGHE